MPPEAGVPGVRLLAYDAHVRLGAAVSHLMPPQRVVGAERLVALVAADALLSSRIAVAAAVFAALVLVHAAVRSEALRTVAARVRLDRIVQALVQAQTFARFRAERTLGANVRAGGGVRGDVRTNGTEGFEGALTNLWRVREKEELFNDGLYYYSQYYN